MHSAAACTAWPPGMELFARIRLSESALCISLCSLALRVPHKKQCVLSMRLTTPGTKTSYSIPQALSFASYSSLLPPTRRAARISEDLRPSVPADRVCNLGGLGGRAMCVDHASACVAKPLSSKETSSSTPSTTHGRFQLGRRVSSIFHFTSYF